MFYTYLYTDIIHAYNFILSIIIKAILIRVDNFL